MGRKRGRSGGRQIKKQKLPAGIYKVDRKLSPERMRVVIESLREVPILSQAASKAGIHRKTLEYWLKCSEAGDDGYDIEWREVIWRFHEHCQTAIEEAYDKVLGPAWEFAMGVAIDCPKCEARLMFYSSSTPRIDSSGFESYRATASNAKNAEPGLVASSTLTTKNCCSRN